MTFLRFYTTTLFLFLISSTSLFTAEVFHNPNNNHVTLQLDKDEIAIFGYGSLMLREQLHNTTGHPYSGPFIQAYLSGFKRSWSARAPHNTTGDSFIPQNVTYLNLEASPNSTVNGIIFVSSKSDLASYDQREFFYNRIDVTDQLQNICILGGEVITYSAQPNYVFPTENATKNETVITQRYINIIKKALATLGDKFSHDFYNSTQALPTHLIFE